MRECLEGDGRAFLMRVNIAGLTPAFSANAAQGMPVLFRYRLMSLPGTVPYRWMTWLVLTFRFRDPWDRCRSSGRCRDPIGNGRPAGLEQGVQVDAGPRVRRFHACGGGSFVHYADAVSEVGRHVVRDAPTLFRIGVRLSHTSRSAVVWSMPTQSPSLLTLRYRSLSGFHPPYMVFSAISPSVRCSPTVSRAVSDGLGAVVSEVAFTVHVMDGIDDVM